MSDCIAREAALGVVRSYAEEYASSHANPSVAENVANNIGHLLRRLPAVIAALSPERPKLDARVVEAVEDAALNAWTEDEKNELHEAIAALRNTHTIVEQPDAA